MIVVVTGGRYFDKYSVVAEALEGLLKVDLIIQGGATGADRLAEQWAQRHDVPCLRVPALWNDLGKPAGPMRNAKMLDWARTFAKGLSLDTMLMAFPGGNGTASCVKLAHARGMHVVEVP